MSALLGLEAYDVYTEDDAAAANPYDLYDVPPPPKIQVPKHLMPSYAIQHYIHASGARFEHNPDRAHTLLAHYVTSTAYLTRMYPASKLEAARKDAIANCLPLTLQMMCEPAPASEQPPTCL